MFDKQVADFRRERGGGAGMGLRKQEAGGDQCAGESTQTGNWNSGVQDQIGGDG